VVYLDLRVPGSFDLLENPDRDIYERNLIRSLVKRSYIVFDIGANVGLYTATVSPLVTKVYAFEPNPALHPQLSMTCKQLGNAELVTVALSDTAGETSLFAPIDHSMASLRDWTGGSTSALTCHTARLDDLNLPLADFIKCDVEGAELNVFRGAQETIRQARPTIFYEANAASVRAFNQSISAATDFLRELVPEYSFYRLCGDGSLRELRGFDFRHANLLATVFPVLQSATASLTTNPGFPSEC
jgi:FkbM family methyltransferase